MEDFWEALRREDPELFRQIRDLWRQGNILAILNLLIRYPRLHWAFLRAYRASLAMAPKIPWWRFFSRPVVLLWLLAIIAWMIAIWEMWFVEPKQGVAPGPVCEGTGEDRITRVADVTAWGARRSHNQAVEEAEKFCPTLAAACVGTCANGNPCQPKPHLINEEQFNLWYATRTVLEYNCECTCV